MPQYFKGMATVAVWGLYVGSWLSAALNFIFGGIIEGYAYGATEVPMSYYISYAVCIGFAFAAGFMMIVRNPMISQTGYQASYFLKASHLFETSMVSEPIMGLFKQHACRS